MNSEKNLSSLLDLIVSETTKVLHAERTTLYLHDREKSELWSLIAQGDGVGEIRLKVGQGLAGHVAETKESIKIDEFEYLHLPDDRLLVIVKDTATNIIKQLDDVQTGISRQISFIETAEISLINLVKANYDFEQEEITVIVYIGYEYSRMIFMRGEDLFNISYIIGVDLQSDNICNTIYSRLLLEQDNLSLPKIDNLILCGEAFEVEFERFLRPRLPEEIKIEYINFQPLFNQLYSSSFEYFHILFVFCCFLMNKGMFNQRKVNMF